MKELHVIKTNVEPTFFNMEYVMDDAERQRKKATKFVIDAQKEYDGLRFPFYAIAETGGGIQEHPRCVGHERFQTTARDLADRIDDLASRDAITAVVDFTNGRPHILGSYELLKEKYNLVMHAFTVVEK
jgi:hypothetical protein